MKWSSNHRACKTVWAALSALEQIPIGKSFESTGDVPIRQLAFFPQDAGSDIREARTQAFALQLDGVLRNIRGATCEAGFNKNRAVTAMTAVLREAEETVAGEIFLPNPLIYICFYPSLCTPAYVHRPMYTGI